MILLKDYGLIKQTCYGVIYKITNIIDGKYYIGRTKEFNARMKAYIKKFNMDNDTQDKLHKAFKKYGLDNFSIEIIDYGFNDEDLNLSEKHYMPIELVNSKNVYNLKEGGDYSPLSEETRLKMKATQNREEHKKRQSNIMKKIWETEEHKEKQRLGVLLACNTEEHKTKQRDGSKKEWEKNGDIRRAQQSTEEHKKKISDGRNKEKIINGIRIYYSNIKTSDNGLMLTIDEMDKFNNSCVSGCLNGKNKSHKGYTFEYVRVDENNNIIERGIKMNNPPRKKVATNKTKATV